MKMLLIHADHFDYEVKQKAMENPEKIDSIQRKDSFDEVLVVFCTVEKIDETNPEQIVSKSVDSIGEVAGWVNSKNIMLYPYAHLSSELGSKDIAIPLLKKMEVILKERNFNVKRSPFGWYKSFQIKCKGHPLSELSRSVTLEPEEASKALLAEKKLQSSWYVLDLDGKLTSIDSFNFADHESLEKFVKYEVSKSRVVQSAPPHISLMRKLEIADYEPGSDPGNLRWYPKGRLIKSLIEQYVSGKTIEYGAMEVETPVMYDMAHPSLSEYLNRFPARQYVLVSGNRTFFLRFSACFGQFLMLKDMQISYKHLPLRIYELTRYSFRREKRGELVGLRRLRAFTMPDCHAVCANLSQALKEANIRFKLCIDVLREGLELGRNDFELGLRFTRSFYDENKDFVIALVKLVGKPALIEMWDQQFFYFIFKWEFNFVDNLGKASALSTDQIDTENAKRYAITYTGENNESVFPLILHCSPSGAIERCVYALLEKAYRIQMEGGVPTLPLWLAPVQIRLIPVSKSFQVYAEELLRKLEINKIRVDVDDRELTVGKRVRDAEMEWISYIIVIGSKEVNADLLSIRDREKGKIRKMNLQDLITEITEKTENKPFKPLTLPKLLSSRPQIC